MMGKLHPSTTGPPEDIAMVENGPTTKQYQMVITFKSLPIVPYYTRWSIIMPLVLIQRCESGINRAKLTLPSLHAGCRCDAA
jgi:hypothetical protein